MYTRVDKALISSKLGTTLQKLKTIGKGLIIDQNKQPEPNPTTTPMFYYIWFQITAYKLGIIVDTASTNT